MQNNFFSDLLFREPIINDNVVKTDNQFLNDFNNLKTVIPNSAPKYEVAFKKPLFPIRKYYHKLISNEATVLFNELLAAFSTNNIFEENLYLYQKFYKIFSENLNNIKDYLDKRKIKEEDYTNPEYNYYSDEAYIIYFFKANAIMLFMELQDRFSEFRSNDTLSIEEIYEVYFMENAPNNLPVIPLTKTTQKPIKEIKTKETLKFKPIIGEIEIRPTNEKIISFKKLIKKTDKFSILEEKLFYNKIIDYNYNFIAEIGNKQLLAAFIHQLVKHEYIQSRIFPGNKVVKDRNITKFFAQRYGQNSDCDKEFRNFKNKDRHKLQKLIDNNYWLDSII